MTKISILKEQKEGEKQMMRRTAEKIYERTALKWWMLDKHSDGSDWYLNIQ